MSGMNEWLAQAYGTNGAASNGDVEKTAQSLMLNKLAEQEGIDLSGLNEQQLALLAQEVSQQMAMQQQGGAQGGMPPMGGAGAPGPASPPPAQSAQAPAPAPGGAAPGGEPQGGQFSDEQVKVAQAKMAEADFLGRMMAHAMHQELGIIKRAEEEGKEYYGSEEDKKRKEEEEAEKTAMEYLASRGFSITKQASAEGPLVRAIRALNGNVR